MLHLIVRHPPRQPHFLWLKVILVSLLAGILGALIVVGATSGFSNIFPWGNQNGSDVKVASDQKGGNSLDGKSHKYKSVHEMIDDQAPAIVGVINEQRAQNLGDLLQGKSAKAEPTGIGSGVVYEKIMAMPL